MSSAPKGVPCIGEACSCRPEGGVFEPGCTRHLMPRSSEACLCEEGSDGSPKCPVHPDEPRTQTATYSCVNACGALVSSHSMHCPTCLRAFNAGVEHGQRRPTVKADPHHTFAAKLFGSLTPTVEELREAWLALPDASVRPTATPCSRCKGTGDEP